MGRLMQKQPWFVRAVGSKKVRCKNGFSKQKITIRGVFKIFFSKKDELPRANLKR